MENEFYIIDGEAINEYYLNTYGRRADDIMNICANKLVSKIYHYSYLIMDRLEVLVNEENREELVPLLQLAYDINFYLSGEFNFDVKNTLKELNPEADYEGDGGDMSGWVISVLCDKYEEL